jgi:serine/threonine protein kinase
VTDSRTELIEQLTDALASNPELFGQVIDHLRTGQDVNLEGNRIIIGDIIVATQGSNVIHRSDGAKITLADSEHAEVVRALLAYRRRVMGEEVATIAAKIALQAGARLDLRGKNYLIRQVLAQQAVGTLVVRTARASDVSVGRDVGIRQIEALTDTPEIRANLRRVVTRAQTFGQVASRCGHLPQLYDVVDQAPASVWVIVEWIRGAALDKLLPQSGPLPDAPALAQLLSWAADVCDALSALHQRRMSHAGVCRQAILVTRSRRGVVLVDVGFTTQSDLLVVEPLPYNPVADVRDLAATLYKVVTHHPAQDREASDFNPAVPSTLDEALQAALSGSTRQASILKRALLAAKRGL